MSIVDDVKLAARRASGMALVCIATAAWLTNAVHAQEATGSTRERLLALPEVGQWLEKKLTEAELQALDDEDLTVYGARCGC